MKAPRRLARLSLLTLVATLGTSLPGWAGLSPSPFAAEPTLQVLSPNGGESLPIGSMQKIAWTGVNLSRSSDIYVFFDHDGVNEQIAGPLSVDASAVGWVVPPVPTTTGRVLVGSWNGTGWEATDSSDKSFTIPGAAVCVPDRELACGDSDSWGTDAGDSTSVISSYACSSLDYSGPEYAYSFTAPYAATFTVTLTNLSADLDLMLLRGESCTPDSCFAASTNRGTADEQITFAADAGQSYRFVVDGYAGATGTYTISVDCTESSAPQVAVGSPHGGDSFAIGSAQTIAWSSANLSPTSETYVFFDHDGMAEQVAGPLPASTPSAGWEIPPAPTATGRMFVGSWNGTDWDATAWSDGYFTVPYSPFCVPDYDLACGDSDSWAADAGGQTNVISSYACSPDDYSGPEYAYSFTAPDSATVTVTLTNLSDDLDLMLLEGGSCTPQSCLKASTNRGTADEQITFDAQAGQSYRFVVDGYAGATGTYSISVDCGGQTRGMELSGTPQ